MLSKPIISAINNQIQAEMASANLYLQMAAYFEDLNLKGFAKWMLKQHQEELEHGLKFFHFLHDCDARAEIMSIEKPKSNYKSVKEALTVALGNERYVSKRINELYELALKEKNYAFQKFLHWFLEEQVEEENQLMEIIGRLEIGGEKDVALLILDSEVGNREK